MCIIYSQNMVLGEISLHGTDDKISLLWVQKCSSDTWMNCFVSSYGVTIVCFIIIVSFRSIAASELQKLPLSVAWFNWRPIIASPLLCSSWLSSMFWDVDGFWIWSWIPLCYYHSVTHLSLKWDQGRFLHCRGLWYRPWDDRIQILLQLDSANP